MKKTISLTESELINVLNKIVESYDSERYDEEDYVEVFLLHFRPWVRKNHGDEIGEYPLSFLVEKYISDFVVDNGMDPENIIRSYRNNLINAASVGRNLVQQGKHKLPSLRSQVKFTEKFKKPLEFFVNELNLPDFIEIKFIEEHPYDFLLLLNVDWVKLVTSSLERAPHISRISGDLQKRITDFLGVEIGNPTYGQLKFDVKKEYVGIEEWVKKSLNKEIKKKIRELPNSKILHAIKFEAYGSSLGGELKMSFKNWGGRHEFIRSVKELLTTMGYNTNILKVVQ